MDKAFKIEKEQLVSNFKVACDKLEYQDVEINPVTDSITYKAIGQGLQWGTNAIVKVSFSEKGDFTNASFQVLKEIRFPMIGKQRIIDSFYKEIIGLVELLNKSSRNNDSIEKGNLNLLVEDSDKGSSIVDLNQSKYETLLNSNKDSKTVEKYLEANKKSNNNKLFVVIGISVVFGLFILLSGGEKGSSSTSDPISCLTGVDWVYPSASSPTGAWKFSYDGTFNSSTTMCGGMSTWGNWEDLGSGRIKITYTRTTENYLPESQILELSNCNSLKVGSTVYIKD
jgi:hypothetical protein